MGRLCEFADLLIMFIGADAHTVWNKFINIPHTKCYEKNVSIFQSFDELLPNDETGQNNRETISA